MGKGKGKAGFGHPPAEINPSRPHRSLPPGHPAKEGRDQPTHGGELNNLEGWHDRAGGEGKAEVRRSDSRTNRDIY